jgi:hypothetical protein
MGTFNIILSSRLLFAIGYYLNSYIIYKIKPMNNPPITTPIPATVPDKCHVDQGIFVECTLVQEVFDL